MEVSGYRAPPESERTRARPVRDKHPPRIPGISTKKQHTVDGNQKSPRFLNTWDGAKTL